MNTQALADLAESLFGSFTAESVTEWRLFRAALTLGGVHLALWRRCEAVCDAMLHPGGAPHLQCPPL